METYQIVLLCLLSWLAVATLANVAVFPGARLSRREEGEQRGHDGGAPLVSVLIPARNEEHNIEGCAGSLMTQDDPNFEVIVLDDRSEDRTVEILRQLGFAESTAGGSGGKFRYISGEELPAGWAGKPWACHQLARAARGEWLLFTDADTIHAPSSVRAAVESAMRHRAGLFSAWPRQITGTWAEKLVIPMLYLLTHTLLPQVLVRAFTRWIWLARLAGPSGLAALGAANGQFMLFRREVYQRIGGHEAVRNHLVEDVALGRLVMARAGEGEILVNADGSSIVSCRMYRGFREVWEGFSKNLRPVFGSNVLAFVGSGMVQATLFILPFVFALLPLPGQAFAQMQVVVILSIRAILTLRFRTSVLSFIFHPFAYGLALAIAVNSWVWSARGKIRWKGREYKG